MKPRQKRLAIAMGLLSATGIVVALVLNAFQSNMVFFYSPTQVAAKEAPSNRTFRVGGLVQAGTVQRDGLKVNFIVTDTAKTVPVRYEGILPDLFQEGKGVVAQGKLENGVFMAREVLAKHDENYMPPEAADALKRAQKGQSRLELTMGQPAQGDTAGTAAYGAGKQP
ncbi:MAG: cytochrome c maturation protein CcmE [Aquabacterium sp.]|nr:cytochrome c maturation protein CcmE [Aquabacterium sp.]